MTDKKEVPVPKGIDKDELGDPGEEGFWHAVDFVSNCPHLAEMPVKIIAAALKGRINDLYPTPGCSHCADRRENWYCLSCGTIGCSRYINGHAKVHAETSGHPLFMSSIDLTCWCYGCENYVAGERLEPLALILSEAKFRREHPEYQGNPDLDHKEEKEDKEDKEKEDKEDKEDKEEKK